MARKEKNTVDYFPHPSRHGKKMAYIRKKYGNDGYATWFVILEQLGDADRHYLDLSDEIGLMYLETACFVEQDLLLNIIEDLVKLGEFDQELWRNHRILFNEKFVDSIRDAYLKRNNSPASKSDILAHLNISVPGNPQNSTGNTVTSEFPLLKGDGNTQIKLNEIKLNEIKGKGMQGENPTGFSEVLEKDVFHQHQNFIVEDFPKSQESESDPPPTNEVVKSGAKKRLTQLEMMDQITLPYENPEFRQAWTEWLQYKTLIKDTYKAPDTMQAALKKFANHPPEVGILAIHDSISNQWKGVFPENKKYHERTQQTNSQPASTAGTISRIYQKLAESRRAGNPD